MPVPAGGGSTLPDWAPTLDRVAAYCTARTMTKQVDGSNVEQPAFTSSTQPTATQVDEFIADAVAWVLMRTGPIDATLTDSATACAAIFAASSVERRYPERQSSNRQDAMKTADDLLALAKSMREDLRLANEAITGTDPEDPGAVLMPVWSFPAPAPYGDYVF